MAAARREVVIYDRRSGASPEKLVDITGVPGFDDFRKKVAEVFTISPNEHFVLCTTNREEINTDDAFALLENQDTLYILLHIDQELSAQTLQKVDYLPHYDTLVKSGMYEYYASEGQNPLPYAFAELIDNSLAATAHNVGSRKIELRLILDDTSAEKSMMFVVDNGCGMTSWELNNWAVYRLSKFIRKEKCFDPTKKASQPQQTKFQMPRSLNSEISYFGAGGKQAIFFIGHATRMITKPKDSKDVHELCISKEEFEKKEKNKEFVYSGIIRNRKPGDISHISQDDDNMRKVIGEEIGKDSFTCVAIWGITPEHVAYLKHNYRSWCMQLAHIYHYYIHGPSGNTGAPENRVPSPFKNIDIEVKLYQKGAIPKVTNLRDIDDDLQSQYLRTAASTYEFRATVDGTRIVEGVLCYHPFLYDHETYPPDAADPRKPEDDHDYFHNDTRPARGRRPIFQCYWNGRLIPYTTIDEFDWCTTPKKTKNLPVECYNRISGVLWTNDAFQVSTNKLTFMDLENRLRDKSTVFARVLSGVEKRGNMDKQFTEWLQQCHEQCDKQVMFTGFMGLISRLDLQKHKQYPWAVYESIEWDGKVFKKGQLVRIQRTVPIIVGTVRSFYLYGDHNGDVCATGGDIEIQQEPRTLYDEIRSFPLVKLDRKVADKVLLKYIEEEEEKLPDRLVVTWPEGNQLSPNEKRPAGKTIGDIKVEIANRRGEFISKLPGSSQKKLLVELKIVWHSPSGDVTVTQYQCQHAKNWPYWFRKMGNIKNLGSHTLSLQAMLHEGETVLCSGKELPSHKIRFTITEADPEKFTVGILDGPFRVGNPFQIPLEFQDKYGNSTKPKTELNPILKAAGLDLSYETVQIQGNSLVIKGIIAKGVVESSAGKNFTLSVKISGLEEDTQSLKIRLLPGLPHTLVVKPETDVIEVENGSSPVFEVCTVDMAENSTCEPRLIVQCKFQGSGTTGLPTYTADLSNSGKNTLTGIPLHLKNMNGVETLIARFEVLNHKDIPAVQKKVVIKPSQKASSIQISYLGENGQQMFIEREKDLVWIAGEPITELAFTVFDEGGRKVEITQQMASKMKVTWTSRASKDLFLEGKLPDIDTPQSVKQQMYCQVSLTSSGVIDFGFTVKPRHGDPAAVKITCSGSNKVRIGEILQSDILVNVTDKNGNPIKKLSFQHLADLLVIADGLVYTHLVKALGQVTGFVISGIKFDDGKLGNREVCIQWKDLKEFVRLEMIAGPPAKLVYPHYNTESMVTLYHDSKLPKPLIVQLCDTAGNTCAESNIKVQLGIDEGLKVTPSVHSYKTNSEGKADFGTLAIAVRSNQQPGECPDKICTYTCRGIFSLCTKAFYGRSVIIGPLLKIHVPCDPAKPVEIKVKHSGPLKLNAGDELPEFSVSVMTEDGGMLRSVKPSQISMQVWKVEGAHNKHSTKSSRHSPSNNSQKDSGIFYFRDIKGTEVAGNYNVQFIYESGKSSLNSQVISLTVEPGPPAKLVPSLDPGTPTVSNTQQIANRILVQSTKLEIKDEYGNLAGTHLNGTLTVQITGSSPGPGDIPRLIGNVTSKEVLISKGQAFLENMTIQENSPGVDGKEYILRCIAYLPDLPPEIPIPPYDITFLFYNDAHKQAEMANLSKERDHLVAAIKTYEQLFETTHQLLKELESAESASEKEEMQLRSELKKNGLNPQNMHTVNQINAAIERCNQSKQKLERAKRRECSVPPAPDEPDVLGKIGHLAWVEDDNVSRVLSWHMQSDMDCIITHTMSKARDIHHRTNGLQQVLALDSIYKRNLPDWGKPLPHARMRGYCPPGNPIYARNLLIFTKETESCKIVFGMLLGDTIILDSLEEATSYREQVVKNTYCPTLLTRAGERIRSNGKFGGQQNKAPPLEKMKGVVFGEPPPKEFETLSKQITLLQNLRQALERHQQAKKELVDQQKQEASPDMLEKIKEFKEAEKKLIDVEQRLGMTPTRTNASNVTSSRSSTRGIGVGLLAELHKTSPSKRGQTANNLSESPNKRRYAGVDTDVFPGTKKDKNPTKEDSPRSVNGITTRGLSPREVTPVNRRKIDTPSSGSGGKRRRKT